MEELLLNTFPSRDNCIAVVKQYYQERNVILHLHKCSDKRRIIFKCYHGGTYRNAMNLDDKSRKQKTSFKLINCPFQVKATYSIKTDLWKFVGDNGKAHNNNWDILSGYSTCQRLNEE
jgi:Transcription factor AFT